MKQCFLASMSKKEEALRNLAELREIALANSLERRTLTRFDAVVSHDNVAFALLYFAALDDYDADIHFPRACREIASIKRRWISNGRETSEAWRAAATDLTSYFDRWHKIALKIDGIRVQWRGLDALRLAEQKVARLRTECAMDECSRYYWCRLTYKLLCKRWGRRAISPFESWRRHVCTTLVKYDGEQHVCQQWRRIRHAIKTLA